jgi:hypothetical protein
MKKIMIIAVTIVAVIALGNVVLASAQGGQPPFGQNGSCPVSGYTCPFSGTTPMGGRGMMGGQVPGGMAAMHGAMMSANGMHEQVWTAVAKKLGMTYAELNVATQNGQTVAQLAQAKGVSLDALKTAALDAMKVSFVDLVKQGVMTQEQASQMLDHMDDMPMFNFDQGYGSIPGGMMGGQGMMRGRGASGGMMGSGRGMMGGYQQPAGPQG